MDRRVKPSSSLGQANPYVSMILLNEKDPFTLVEREPFIRIGSYLRIVLVHGRSPSAARRSTEQFIVRPVSTHNRSYRTANSAGSLDHRQVPKPPFARRVIAATRCVRAQLRTSCMCFR